VTDTGGVDDKSFNATIWKGAQDASTEYSIDAKYLESKEVADFEKNLNAFVEEKCDIIIAAGYLLGDATKAAAEANPDVNYTIVDYAYDPVIPNVLAQVYQTDEASFLAGYLAAGMSKTAKVGTFGGLPIPTVTIFMDGFVRGVDYYNAQKGTAVAVLGYDLADTTKGLFSMSFDDQAKGKELANSLMDEGADIIMPVAGPVGLGAAAAAKERGNVLIIGVDYDWFVSAPDYNAITLTSVLKNMDFTVKGAVKSAIDGTFAGGTSVGTLANGGVGLAPYHDLDASVPAELKAEVEALKASIIDGSVKIK
jgi:basic membrane protein A